MKNPKELDAILFESTTTPMGHGGIRKSNVVPIDAVILKDPRPHPQNKKIDFTPIYKTSGSAGADVRLFHPNGFGAVINYGHTVKLRTGVFVAIPEGWEIQVRPRSGISAQGVIVTNSPGTIDSDYREEICVLMTNLRQDRNPMVFAFGDRIAQFILAPVYRMKFNKKDSLPAAGTGRTGGFGHTGLQ